MRSPARRAVVLAMAAGLATPRLAAQRVEGRRRIAVLMGGVPDPDMVTALTRDLASRGWIDGRTAEITWRFGEGSRESMRAHALELMRTKPHVMVVRSATALSEARKVSGDTPMVFVSVSDPVGNGFVSNLQRPGGWLTGFANLDHAIAGKWLELLREVAPATRRVLVIQSPLNPSWPGWIRTIDAAAPALGFTVERGPIRDVRDIEPTLIAFARKPGGGMIVLPDPALATQRDTLPALATRLRLPAVYGGAGYDRGAGLLFYGADPGELSRDTADYIDRILRGEKPGNLSVQEPRRFMLVLNASAARALGLALPASLLARADRVVD